MAQAIVPPELKCGEPVADGDQNCDLEGMAAADHENPPDAAIERAAIEDAFEAAAQSYIATRRTRIPYFVDRNFGFRGALRLHRAALGADLIRAPVNLALAIPHIMKLLTAGLLTLIGAKRAANVVYGLPTQLRTAVARQVDWLIWTEFLELPYSERDLDSQRDAMAELLAGQPAIAAALDAIESVTSERQNDPAFRARLQKTLGKYTGTRVATSEIATALASAGVGGLMVQQMTPTAFTLGPALAALIAHQAAIFAFPLGSALGAVWYGLFPGEPAWDLIIGVTAGLMVVSSAAAAFAGVAADPVQRRLGIHRRRLEKLVDSIEADLFGDGGGGFKVRAHYVARMFDIFEAVRIAARSIT